MTAAPSAHPGIEIKGSVPDKTVEIKASDESVKRITLAIERMWNRWLEWAEHNPWLFAAFLICVTIVAVSICFAVVHTRAQRKEYDGHRGNARRQLPLNLPAPPASDREKNDAK